MRNLVVAFSILFATSVFAEPPDFRSQILPVLEAKCTKCHGARQKGGRLDVRTKEALLAGGASGPAIVPGKSDKSLMVDLMFYNEMPPRREKNKVTKDELELIKAWIDAGAPGK